MKMIELSRNFGKEIAIAAGLAIAYIDSRPTWDDTGITAFGVLLASGALAFVSPRRPWLWALAIGIWIPLAGIFISHNFGSLIALVFAFAGAYAGMLARRLVDPAQSR